jgi:hypothetical protein
VIEVNGNSWLLSELGLKDTEPWAVLETLAEKLGHDENALRAILRPHDETGNESQWNKDSIEIRRRLDKALELFTLIEIGCEAGLLTVLEATAGNGTPLPQQMALKQLVSGSDAFLRYATAYLYFGTRILAGRLFGPSWMGIAPPEDRQGDAINRRWFAIEVPPPPIAPLHDTEGAFRAFLKVQRDASCSDALNFLDGFYESSGKKNEGWSDSSEEPAQFELWLRGLRPEAELTEGQVDRFKVIQRGMQDAIHLRATFYKQLEDEPQNSVSNRMMGEELITNPVAARFALADIYWIARLLRAEVSGGAAVTYSRVSWIHLLAFRATLYRDPVLEKQLQQDEKVLRSVFDFVCDLAQNSVALSEDRERRHFNPEDYVKLPERTWQWRAVFDEELREVDRQRSRRTYAQTSYSARDPLSCWDNDRHPGWSERLITGKQPHNLVGLAFSGGGIRSATFNLGVLQGLQEFDLLRNVDYLSTVSGGGFIGSWLSGNVRRTRHWMGRATCWDESIEHLRSYSSYLSPTTGLLSADTWTLAASWLRNAFLIQVTGFAWLLALLLVALSGRMLFANCARYVHGIVLKGGNPRLPTGAVGLLAIGMGVLVTGTLITNFVANRVETGRHSPKAEVLRWLAVLPSWIGSFLVAVILWADAWGWSGSHDYSLLLRTGWRGFPVLLAAHFVSLLIIGWFALKPPTPVSFRADKEEGASPEPGNSAASEAAFLKFQQGCLRIWRSVWIGAVCVGVLYLELCGILYLFLDWHAPYLHRYTSYAYIFGPALTMGAFTVSVVLFIGFSGRRSNEATREWWTRFGAWLLIYASAGLALSAAALFGPYWIHLLKGALTHSKHPSIPWAGVASWFGTIIGGIFAGSSSKTAGNNASGKKLVLELIAKLGGLLFVVATVIGSAAILHLFLVHVWPDPSLNGNYWHAIDQMHLNLLFVEVCLGIALIGILFSWYFEINIFGLSQFYRNRLVRCYLGATRWAPGIRKPHPFTKFDFQDDLPLSELKDDFSGPFPLYNCTLNLAGSSDLRVHTRHSASFTLTPLRCGTDRVKVGYAPTGQDSDPGESFAGGVKLGQAVAISGAAASPNMGYNTSPLVALLLTMFNVRLGWWFPNPGQKKWNAKGLSFSLYYLFQELLGIADDRRLFLNVSDGGHFENLGVYELIRRRCKVIIACDAECDEVLQFGGLGNLIRICATDFGAVIDLDVKAIRDQKDDHSLAHCSVGQIKYSNGSIGYLLYLKASVTGDEDVGTTQYRSAHPSFPHETTANQFFSEDQFESYRKLGLHIVRNSFRVCQPGEHPLDVAVKLSDVMAPSRTTGEAFLRHTQALNRIWDEFRKSMALHSFIDELMNINPPMAVVTAAGSDPDQQSQELCVALELLQLMEDVFMDLRLEDYWEHPDNRGWAIMFMRWARSPRFRLIYTQTHRTFGIRFEYFCESRLGLSRDRPIVRV